MAAAVGDSNAGDFWVDTAGAPPGPGNETDPHLPCANVTVWGARLADPSGTYAVDGWSPTGTGKQAYSSTWAYNTTKRGTQTISTIDIATLIDTALANGDTPTSQGWHFKIALTQDPSKYKTFWVNCGPNPIPTSSPSTTGTSPTPTGTSPTTTGTSPSPTGTPPSTSTKHKPQRVKGTSKHRKRHPKLVPPAHRHHVKNRHVKSTSIHRAVFTG